MQKDISEKSLQSFNEVFADIVNVLLFDGEQIVKQDELEDALPNSFYKIDGKLHRQERDVAKIWKNGEIRISYMGLENQTVIDRYMPLRIMYYDSAVYRHQIDERDAEIKSAKKENREILDCFEVRPELKPFVNNFKINIIEMAYLLSVFTNNADLKPLQFANQSLQEEHMFDGWYYKMKDRTRYETAIQVAKALILLGKITDTDIAKCVDLPLDEIQHLAENFNKHHNVYNICHHNFLKIYIFYPHVIY